jgi:catechol 2,3-dioxygenase
MSLVKMAPRRLAHFNLYVSNLPRSTAFYHQICGIHHIAGEPDVPIHFLTNGSSHHELGLIEIHEGERIGREGFVQGSTPKGQKPGLNHLGWEMATEATLVEAYKRLQGQPLRFHTADHTIAHSVYVADVDGNMHEFFADTPYDWPRLLRGNLERITGRWDPLTAAATTEIHYDRGLSFAAVPDAAVRPSQISHCVLRVRDFQGQREWLRDVAGLEEMFVSQSEGRAVYRGSDSPTIADLVVERSDEGGALARMAFLMPNIDEMDHAQERLAALGIRPIRVGSEKGVESFVLADPDGLEIEFFALADARAVPSVEMFAC